MCGQGGGEVTRTVCVLGGGQALAVQDGRQEAAELVVTQMLKVCAGGVWGMEEGVGHGGRGKGEGMGGVRWRCRRDGRRRLARL